MASRVQAKTDKILKELARVPANKKCAICTCVGTQYTCQPPGIYVCETCAGAIRSYPGFRVKSRTMATYSAEDVKALQEGGNEKFLQMYLAKWNASAFPPPSDKDAKKIDSFVRQVLVEKIFYDENAASKPVASRPPSAQGSESMQSLGNPGVQTSPATEPGWQAFESTPKHVHTTSLDQSHTGPSSDSWADFTPAPGISGPSRQTTGSSHDVFPSHPQRSPSLQSVGTRSEGMGMQNSAISQPASFQSPQGWKAFNSDPFSSTPQSNGTAQQHTGGTSVGSPSSVQAASKPKAPVMKELPEDLFGPPQVQAPVAPVAPVAPAACNPFGSGSFAGQVGGFTNVIPNPHQPVAAQQPYQMGPQGFSGNQSMSHNLQQARISPGQAIPGFGHQAPLPPTPIHTSAHPFPQSPNSSQFIGGLSNSENESDHILFGNLMDDLRSSLPKPRLQRSESLQYGVQGQHGAHPFGTQPQNRYMGNQAFPPQSAFGAPALQQTPFPNGTPNQPLFPGAQQPNQSYMQGREFGRVQSMAASPGYQPQVGQAYGTTQPGMMGQSPGGLQGGIQSSGNPFA